MSRDKHVAHLSEGDRRRYEEKVAGTGIGDPVTLPSRLWKNVMDFDFDNLPHIECEDIYLYLVIRKSAYTHESLKSFKALSAHQYLTSGKVQNVRITRATTTKFVVIAKVCGKINRFLYLIVQ